MATRHLLLQQFRVALDKLYGTRIDRVVLYGSRARGDAHVDSDYDVAVFITDLADRWSELKRLADIETDFLYATGAVVNALPFRADSYQDRTPLMHEIRRDGLDL